MTPEEEKLKRFETLYAEAESLSRAGQQRQSADKYIEAVFAAPSVTTKNRNGAFCEFMNHIKCVSATKNDVKLLKKIINNDEESAYLRAGAASAIGIVRMYQERNDHDAAEYFLLCLKIIKEAAPEEQESLAVLKFEAESNMNGLEGKMPSASQLKTITSLMQKAGSSGFNLDIDKKYHPKTGEEELMRRTFVGGSRCDGCHKTVKELNMEELLKCGRCMMAYYCSSSCQHKAWKGGHKGACRKKGEIKVGDDMMLRGLSSSSGKELNGRFVKVVSTGATNGKWIVKLRGSERQLSISGDKLDRLRPTA